MSTSISYEEAQRAIYFDVEGRAPKKRGAAERPPVLAGVLIDGEYQAILLKDDLRGAAEARGIDCMPLEEVLKYLHKKASEEGRKIVFFSSTEEGLFTKMGFELSDMRVDLKDLCEGNEVYEGVRKEWKKYQKKDRNSSTLSPSYRATIRRKAYGLLTLFAAKIGLPRPSNYGPGLVGKRIRYFEKQNEEKPTYEAWSRMAKKNLTDLIDHNEHDVKATEFVLHYLLG